METLLVLDFGGQYKELIARRVRENNVYSEIRPGNLSIEEIKKIAPVGIILTGGPDSVYLEDAPEAAEGLFELDIPILAICYGFQLMVHTLGGKVASSNVKEYGVLEAHFDTHSLLFSDTSDKSPVLMSHTDKVTSLPSGFKITASTPTTEVSAAENREKKLYGVQFHPEVIHTKYGEKIIANFLFNICNAKGDYCIGDIVASLCNEIKEKSNGKKVLLGLSGGVDSSVCAALLSKAIPDKTVAIFVDHGLMRKNEGDEIEKVFKGKRLNFIRINAQDRFLDALKGVTDPEKKRKIIGELFVRIFEEEAKKHKDIRYLAQGTIYPDVIESGAYNSANIKSHHNVGGLPEQMDFDGIIEPLRRLFKDEVRALGKILKLPDNLISRQPFPGPGLAVRIIGEITLEKLNILREADAIFRESVDRMRKRPDQYFAVLTDTKTVGVMGDFRTYSYTLALRAVKTDDFMTCSYAKIPHSRLEKIAQRIVNEVEGINRVVYDITGKPPATVEWE